MKRALIRTTQLLTALAWLFVGCQRELEVSPDLDGLSPLPAAAPDPADNPRTPAKVSLGRVLFWDPILSGPRDVSCASCHHPSTDYAEPLDLAIGVNGRGLGRARHFQQPNDLPFAQRNTPTVLNAAFNGIGPDGSCQPASAPMFWDLRAQSLEAQALLPIVTLEEMRGHQYGAAEALDSVVARLRHVPEYEQLFAEAFGSRNSITAANLGRALACFERSLVATDTPYDRYLRGDKGALTTRQLAGLQAFVGSGCAKCHSGPMLSDYKTHVLGAPDNEKRPGDSGQGGTFAFRTPSLRQVAGTGPYMHSGKLPTLDAVLRFYDPGRGVPLPPVPPGTTRDPLFPTRVTDPAAIIEFLQTLSATDFDRTIPARVPSGLAVGGAI